jgi:hypothetical protein
MDTMNHSVSQVLLDPCMRDRSMQLQRRANVNDSATENNSLAQTLDPSG